MEKCAADPPSIFFLKPNGVFTLSKATVPKTRMLICLYLTPNQNAIAANILYIPNGIKVCFLMKTSKKRMAKRATIKDTIKPTPRAKRLAPVNAWIFFVKSNTIAAHIVGTASRKENSTIVLRLRPRASPPTMVAAERDTPGIIAIVWKSPINNALE
jgi:hypothetical protein